MQEYKNKKKKNKGNGVLYTLILLFAVTSILFASGCAREEMSEQDICEDAGGNWELMPNSCVDSCEYNRNPDSIICAQALTYGCNCGEGMCWNGNDCVEI